MPTTTPNFGWSVPVSTDLVKDGATAIELLGDSIDASLVDLKGGTSGQVLAKNSNTDMDFVWVTNADGDITGVTAGTGISGGGTSGTVTVTNSMATAIDAKGDLIAGTGADAFARLGVGTNGQVLTADSAAATGLAWSTVGGSSGPAFFAFLNANQTGISSNVWTKVNYNAENFDTDNCFDTSNGRFTPNKAGYYDIKAYAAGRVTGNLNIYFNGSNYIWLPYFYNDGEGGGGSALIYFNGTTDYVEVFGRQSGSSLQYYGMTGSFQTFFQGVWIRG
jgi:hypothetical protein